jgi:hypothetical protein
MAENTVPQKYVGEKRRRSLLSTLREFGNSFFILIQNFELFLELKALSSPLSDDNSVSRAVTSLLFVFAEWLTIHIQPPRGSLLSRK